MYGDNKNDAVKRTYASIVCQSRVGYGGFGVEKSRRQSDTRTLRQDTGGVICVNMKRDGIREETCSDQEGPKM